MMGRAPQELRAGPEGLEPPQVGFILPAISRTEHFSSKHAQQGAGYLAQKERCLPFKW